MKYYLKWAVLGLVVGLTMFAYSAFPNYERMQDSTVYLEIYASGDCEGDHPGQQTCSKVLGHASGVILENGYILTAAHVADAIKAGYEIKVRFRHGEELPARLIAKDYDKGENGLPNSDIALLRTVHTFDYPAATVNCSTSPVGTSVFVVGHPANTLWTTTQGHVMGMTPRKGHDKGSWLAVDATIWKGNSGGPIFNRWGEIIGITSHGLTVFMSPIGLNYGVSGPTICTFLEDTDEYSSSNRSDSNSWFRGEQDVQGQVVGMD